MAFVTAALVNKYSDLKNIFFYLFIWLHWIFSCSMQDLQSSLWHAGSLVEACKLLVAAMWDLVPWLGIEPGPPTLGVQSLSHWTTREVPTVTILNGMEGLFEEVTFEQTQVRWARGSKVWTKHIAHTKVLRWKHVWHVWMQFSQRPGTHLWLKKVGFVDYLK